MWIFCAGSKRSGSTLQYNIASRIIELKKRGQRLKHSKPEEFCKVLSDNKEVTGVKVFKTHLLTEEIKEFISSSREDVKIIYCFRDVRDVNVSLIKKGWIDKTLESLSNTTKSYIKDYNNWMVFEDLMYKSKYEDFYNNINIEIKSISKYLGIDINEEEVIQITDELSAETIKKTDLNYEKKEKFFFDTKTLLHENHIQGKDPNQFKTFLTDREVVEIERIAYNWLSKKDYKLTWRDSDYFVSYSQHADDYIAWQLLGKKNKGVVVEVGAFDGQHLSNSKSLEDMGWHSICIEPSPEIFKFLKENRPNSNNLNLAVVGDDSIKEIDFYSEELGVLSGCVVDEDDLKRRYDNRGLDYKEPTKIKVKAQTLNAILEGQNNQSLDLMSIDVEGFELEVLKGLDLNVNDVKMFIIEANDDVTKTKILNYFKTYPQYMFAGNNFQNLFFVKTKVLSKKNVRQLDFNYVKAEQIHPKGEKFTIDSTQPNFLESKELSKFKKYLNLF